MATTQALTAFLRELLLKEIVYPHPFRDDGRIFFEFLVGESDL